MCVTSQMEPVGFSLCGGALLSIKVRVDRKTRETAELWYTQVLKDTSLRGKRSGGWREDRVGQAKCHKCGKLSGD